MDLKFSMCDNKAPVEGSVSQIFYLGPSLDFMPKNR